MTSGNDIDQKSTGDGSHSQSTTGDGSHGTVGNGNVVGNVYNTYNLFIFDNNSNVEDIIRTITNNPNNSINITDFTNSISEAEPTIQEPKDKLEQ